MPRSSPTPGKPQPIGIHSIPEETVVSRLAAHGLTLDESHHPSLKGHAIFAQSHHNGKLIPFELRAENLRGMEDLAVGKGQQFRRAPKNPSDEKTRFLEAVVQTYGKPIFNPQKIKPRVVLHRTWHAFTKDMQPVLFVDDEIFPVHMKNMGNALYAYYQQLLEQSAKARSKKAGPTKK